MGERLPPRKGASAVQAIETRRADHDQHASAILVVDDDAALARMLLLTLKGGGYRVSAARNGAEALDQVEAARPDLILLDLEMPVMDGRQFYRELRARGFTAPVLILSAYEARSGQRELGADAYLNKPFNPDELLEQVQRLLDGV